MQWIRLTLTYLFDLLFGCRHTHLSRPFTLEDRSYKICLDCGQERPYSVEAMRLLHPWEIAKPLLEPVSISVESGLSERTEYNRTKAVA